MKKKYCMRKAEVGLSVLYNLWTDQVTKLSEDLWVADISDPDRPLLLVHNNTLDIGEGVSVFRELWQTTKSLISSMTSEEATAELLINQIKQQVDGWLRLGPGQQLENVVLLNVAQQLIKMMDFEEFLLSGSSEIAALLGFALSRQIVNIKLRDLSVYCSLKDADDITDMVRAINAGGDWYWISTKKIYPDQFGNDGYGVNQDPANIPADERNYLLVCTTYRSEDKLAELAAHWLGKYLPTVSAEEVVLLD